MSDLTGDLSHLHQTRIPFSAVVTDEGLKISGKFSLLEATGVKCHIPGRASIKIVSDSLVVKVFGPASAKTAIDAYVAVLPSCAEAWPTEPEHVLTIGGSTFAQHSLFAGNKPGKLTFGPEVAHQIKPAPQVGYKPWIAYVVEVIGGDQTTKIRLVVSGILEVDGIGHIKTW